MWGIVPAAGIGSRIQPLACSKELLPVGSRLDGEIERPRAVSEYLLDRMLLAGARNICFVISPEKSDILRYYSSTQRANPPLTICYVVQPNPAGLCDALFRALPLIPPEEEVLVGLPDTLWFPEDALLSLPASQLSFLLFPAAHPEFFDAVLTDDGSQVLQIRVKQPDPGTSWIWGAFKMTGAILGELHELWLGRDRADEYVGTLVNEYLRRGGRAQGVRAGRAYVDVGTLDGYRDASRFLKEWDASHRDDAQAAVAA